MSKYKVYRTYGEWIYVEAENEDEAYYEAKYDSSSNREYDIDPNDVELIEEVSE